MEIKDLSKIDIVQLTRNKNLLANIGIILLTLFITRGMHLNQMQKIDLLKEQIAKENEIAVFIDDLKALEDKIDALQKELQLDSSPEKVMERVSLLAKKHNLKVSSIDTQSIIDKKMYQIIPIRMKISSDYHKLGHLISDIENTGVLKVKGINITNEARYSSKTPVESEINLDLVVFSLKKK